MDISLIMKVAGVGLLVAAAHAALPKQSREEYSTYIILAGMVTVFLVLIPEIIDLFESVMTIFEF
jgi:stage III sporulation protein AC